MTMGMPEWALEIPSAPVHQEQSNQLVRPFTAQQLIEFGLQLIEQFIKRVVLALAGFFIPGIPSFDQLVEWGDDLREKLADIPILGDIIEAITGVEDGDLNDLGTFFLNVRTFLGSINFLDPDFNLSDAAEGFTNLIVKPFLDFFGNIVDGLNSLLGPIFGGLDFGDLPTPEEVWGGIVNVFMLPLNLLLGPNSAISALNIFGDISQLSIGALTNNQPNLVLGEFPNLASIFDNPKWSFDASVTHTAGGTGSARTSAGGVLRALRSKPRAVDANQKLAASVWAKCQGITGSGAAVHLDLVRYSGTVESPVEIGTVRLATLARPVGNSDWAQLSANYTVPSGTTLIAERLVVDAATTGGTVWFDDAVLRQTGSLLLDWMPEALEKFLSIFNIFGDGGVIDEMEDAWQNLLSLLGLGSKNDLLGAINTGEIWQTIAEFLINPLGFFANLVGGKLPDSQKPQWLQDLNDGIANLFNGSSDVNTGISNALESLGNVLGIGHQAQSSADNANIGVQILNARLDAVGVVGYDEFDYGSANILPSDKYALTSSGPGGGNYGPNGKGQLEWKPSGLSAREKVYKRTDMPLDTDNGAVTAVWSTRIKDPLFSDGYGYLQGRMYNANNDTYIRARIDNNTAVIQAVVGGSVTSIGSSASVSTSNGDVWEFWYGTLTNPYRFWLKQNGSVVLSVEDTGHVSLLGPDYRMCGLGGRADNYAALFQIPPPTVNGWTWRDQNVASVS